MKLGIIAIMVGLTMIMAGIAFSQVPGIINYQGRLTDPNGAPVADSSTNNFTFSIYESTNAATPVWAEAHPNVPVMNGLFSVLLGSVTNPLSPTLFATNAGITRWLQVEVNGETLAPRKELVSVAYALQAGNAATLAGFAAGEFAASSLTNEIIALQGSTNFLLSQTIILQGATNVLQAQATDLQTATGALNTAVGNLNTATGALQIAVGDLQTATNALQIQVGALQSATNALNLATNALQGQFTSLATAVVTQAQDPMIISNGVVFLDYDTNDFVLRGQIGINTDKFTTKIHSQAQFVEVHGDTMSGNLVMQNPAVIQGVGIIDSAEITDLTIDDDDISTTADIAGTKVRVATTDARGTVELATGTDTAAGLVIQANDPRLGGGGGGAETDPQVHDNQTNNFVPRWDGNNNRLVGGAIVDNGSIGIGGTAGAGYRLDVMGQAIVRDHLTVSGGDIWMSANSTIKAPGGRLTVESGEHLILSPAAKVGIGTPSPAAKLDVNGDSLFRGPLSVSGATLTIDRDGGQLKLSGGAYKGGLWTGGGKLYLANWDTGAGAVVDLANGNVGLGTANPGSRLDIGGAAGAANYATLAIKQSYYGQKGIWLQAYQNYNSLSLHHDGSVAHIGTDYTVAGSVTPLTLQAGAGNVGIGMTAPDAKLHVAGNLRVGTPVPPIYGNMPLSQGDAEIYGKLFVGAPGGPLSDLRVFGSIYYQFNILCCSDARIKIDQRQLEYGLTNVMALNPIRYNQAEWGINPETQELIIYPERISKTNEIGLVAQEVQRVIPEAVNVPEDETRQTWGLDYIKLIPVLIKAIQEQQALIEEQKGINAAQETRIKSLEERMAALEQK